MGEILATSGLISSGSVGDIRLTWHDAWQGPVGVVVALFADNS